MKLNADLREFVELLNSHKVEYVIVGGHAVAFHGYPRFTGDIDFFIRRSEANARLVLSVLSDFGFGDSSPTMESLTADGSVIQLGLPPNRIDLLTGISGVDFSEVWATREEANLDGLAVAFIGREALLKNKSASGRSKDKLDVEVLTKQSSQA